MLDIAELLKARKSEFISLRELITRIKLHQPHVSESDIAEVIYLEMSNKTMPEWVRRGIAGSIEKTYVDESNDSDSSLEELLKVVFKLGCMPEVTPPPVLEPPMDFDDDIPF
ncbi:Uncharacterised protein [Yersinia rohdei]|uniref:hypothetical protein n=1 Tax=Yersinia rohdei TaxID=29485 RepID=UPI0005E5E3B8|nr:hypothetical protein [Yersinia rohdei]CNF39546.1 Uncharacterised protein [Yersinia rohdei]CNI52996.1 Uncharacterised protein [Yersinia rohdei]